MSFSNATDTTNVSFAPWKSASQRITTDVVGGRFRLSPFNDHLDAAVNWLKRAHDHGEDHGVSYGYCLRGPNIKNIGAMGWRPSYLETSGYIVETFYDLADRSGEVEFRERAESIARWLITVQNNDGSFSNPQYGVGRGIVFDTGQDLFGLVRAFRETQDELFLNAAQKAAAWLYGSLDADGAWRRNTHKNFVHTYNTRSAWAMLELNDAHPDSEIRDAARRNLDWAMTQRRNAFFENCAFEPGLPPFTHTIAYAIRGFQEAGRLLADQKYHSVADAAATRMLDYVGDDGFIPGRISVDGVPKSKSCCLTGNCQMSIIWYQIAQRIGNQKMLSAANRAMDYVMSVQDIQTLDENVHGAIKGSHPIWGKYTPLAYPNWATKFFIDGMLLKEKSGPNS